MAIKQRKQLTGTTAQINAYAGVEGQLVFDKSTKHLHVLSGTEGTSTKLANISDIPASVDISGKADTSYVDTELAKKANTRHTHTVADVSGLQSVLDGKANSSHTHIIANVTGLQNALDGKQAKGSYATTTALADGLAGKANKMHTHAIADVTGLQTALNTAADKIPKVGNRGQLAGYATAFLDTILVNKDTPDSSIGGVGTLQIANGTSLETWTKVVYMSGGSVKVGDKWNWVGGEAPELIFPCLLVCHWNTSGGIVGIVKGAA